MCSFKIRINETKMYLDKEHFFNVPPTNTTRGLRGAKYRHKRCFEIYFNVNHKMHNAYSLLRTIYTSTKPAHAKRSNKRTKNYNTFPGSHWSTRKCTPFQKYYDEDNKLPYKIAKKKANVHYTEGNRQGYTIVCY